SCKSAKHKAHRGSPTPLPEASEAHAAWLWPATLACLTPWRTAATARLPSSANLDDSETWKILVTRVKRIRLPEITMLPWLEPSLLPAYAAALIFGYLCGSIPFGLILTRLAGTPDIRAIGSGNIGATNVLRTGHKGLAAATLIADALKGTFAVLLIYYYYGSEYRY